NRLFELIEMSGALGGIVQTGKTAQLLVVPDRRHRAERDILREVFLPRLDQRVKITAVRAAVMEELDHFDLARRLRWNAVGQGLEARAALLRQRGPWNGQRHQRAQLLQYSTAILLHMQPPLSIFVLRRIRRAC